MIWLAAGVWLASVVSGTGWMAYHANSPGSYAGVVPVVWPEGSRIPRDTALPTLLLFAHPRCPCTRAALAELARLMARCQGRVNAQIWWMQPHDSGADWEETGLQREAASLPGVTLHGDHDGLEAHRFQAGTSGHAVLYGPDGRLWFQGGITSSRGHEGDNAGRSALEALLSGRQAEDPTTPVFGCPLFDAADGCLKGGPGCPH